MSATKADIVVFRNEVREFSGQYLDAGGLPLSLAGITLSSDAKAQAGTGAILASATFAVVDEAQGLFTYAWDGGDFAAYGSTVAETRVAYDMKFNDNTLLYGQIILKPGVTP